MTVDDAEFDVDAYRASLEQAEKEFHEQELKQDKRALRSVSISVAVFAGLSLLSYACADLVPGWISIAESRVTFLSIAGLGLIVVVLRFLSLRAHRARIRAPGRWWQDSAFGKTERAERQLTVADRARQLAERAEGQFRLATIAFSSVMVIAGCLLGFFAVDLFAIFLSPMIGLPWPNFLFVNGGGGLAAMLVGGCIYLRSRAKAGRSEKSFDRVADTVTAWLNMWTDVWRWLKWGLTGYLVALFMTWTARRCGTARTGRNRSTRGAAYATWRRLLVGESMKRWTCPISPEGPTRPLR
jgi:hypothetical protein